MLHSLAPKSEKTENTKGKLKKTEMFHSLGPKSKKTEKPKEKLKKTEMCLIVFRFHPVVAAVTHESLAADHSFQRA